MSKLFKTKNLIKFLITKLTEFLVIFSAFPLIAMADGMGGAGFIFIFLYIIFLFANIGFLIFLWHVFKFVLPKLTNHRLIIISSIISIFLFIIVNYRIFAASAFSDSLAPHHGFEWFELFLESDMAMISFLIFAFIAFIGWVIIILAYKTNQYQSPFLKTMIFYSFFGGLIFLQSYANTLIAGNNMCFMAQGNEKMSCYNHLAITATDESICSKYALKKILFGDSVRFRSFSVFDDTNRKFGNFDLWNTINGQYTLADVCYVSVADYKKDISFCSNIMTPVKKPWHDPLPFFGSLKQICFGEVSNGNSFSCENLSGRESRDDCFESIALIPSRENISMCEKISSNEERNRCVKTTAYQSCFNSKTRVTPCIK